MRRFRILFAAVALACFAAPVAKGQFYTSGSDAPGLDWQHFKTAHYDIIYPAGLDSLAMEYARSLEKYSAGFENPGLLRRQKIPVILRNRLSYSNGMVVLPPLRMELYTTPDPYDPLPTPWRQHLTSHETRHVEQMLRCRRAPWNWLRVVAGGLVDGAYTVLSAEQCMYEGDAVVAETARSAAGRGRSADFLENYRVSAAEGVERSFYSWRYGSQKHYTPDYYRAGYLAMADMGGNPRFRSLPGKKFTAHFDNALDKYKAFWEENDSLRAPFTTGGRQIVPDPKQHTEYESLTFCFGNMFAIESGLTKAPALVSISPRGHVTRRHSFSSHASQLRPCEETQRIYWSESTPDMRWEYKSLSDIWYLDGNNNLHKFTSGKRYFNPVPSPDGKLVAVCEYKEDGSAAVRLLDAGSGEVSGGFGMPGGMQPVDCCWVDDDIYVLVLGPEGFMICRGEDGMETVLGPVSTQIREPFEHEGRIHFTSDANGVNELYSLDPESGEVLRLTSTRFGASDFNFEGDSLYYSALSGKGRLPYAVAVSELHGVPASLEGIDYPYAPRKDKAAAAEEPEDEELVIEKGPRKSWAILPRFHSWIPVFVDYDAIDDLSLYDITTSVGPGATVFFQNVLGNIYGNASVRPVFTNGWRPEIELNLTTDALYPVFELKLNANSRQAYGYHIALSDEFEDMLVLSSEGMGKPYVNMNLRTYVPLNLSRRGLSIGIVPSATLNVSNERMTADYLGWDSSKGMAMLNVGVRGYVMESVPSSRIYPRLGIGAEIGCSTYLGLGDVINSHAYGMVYGYVPGLAPTHGLRMSVIAEKMLGYGPITIASTASLPRGAVAASGSIPNNTGTRVKFSFDYAIPFGAVDWSFLSPVAYIRNFEFIPHYDLALLYYGRQMLPLSSLGADFCVRLGNLLWIPYDTRIGVGVNYNSSAGNLDNEAWSALSCNLVFSVSF